MSRLTEVADVAAVEWFQFAGPKHPVYSDIARLVITRDLVDPIRFDRVIRPLHDLSEKFPVDGAHSS